jgi:hypothetical protein
MDLVVRNDPTSIPLRCTLCPTHISSKSHLAHRFKAELRARDDRAASEEVRQYDNWCENYGINALLAERMAAKEQKKTGRRGRHSKNAAVSHPVHTPTQNKNCGLTSDDRTTSPMLLRAWTRA